MQKLHWYANYLYCIETENVHLLRVILLTCSKLRGNLDFLIVHPVSNTLL